MDLAGKVLGRPAEFAYLRRWRVARLAARFRGDPQLRINREHMLIKMLPQIGHEKGLIERLRRRADVIASTGRGRP